MNALFLLFPGIVLAIIAYISSKNLERFLALYFVFLVVYTFLNNENAPIYSLFGFGITIWDVFGAILFISIGIRILLVGLDHFMRVSYGKLFLVYFFCEIIIMAFSVATYGPTTLSTYKYSFYFFPFLFLLLTFKNEHSTERTIFNFLRALVVFSIIVYILRVSGIISLYSHYAEAAEWGNWNEIRYLSNSETLYLLIFLIFVIKKRNPYFNININRIISLISLILILTSTQRTITLLLVLFFIYELLTETKFMLKKYSVYVALSVVVFLFLSSSFLYNLDASVNNALFNFAASNGGYRVLDAKVTVETMITRHNYYYGEMITPEIFSRDLGYGVIVNFPVHNLFILSFVHGGLFLTIPMLLFWLVPLGRLLLLRIKGENNLTQEIALLWLASFFIFNNTSGVGIFNSLVFAYSLWALDRHNPEINEPKKDTSYFNRNSFRLS